MYGKKLVQLSVALLFILGAALSAAGALASPADANFLWAKSMGGSGSDFGLSTIDSNGNLFTTGRFEGTVDLDPGPGLFSLTSAGSWDILLSKLDGSGNLVWAKGIGGPGKDFGSESSQDASGNVYLTGYFHDTVDFDPGAGVFNLTSAGYEDVFVCKLDGSGNFLWAKRVGGTGGDYASGIRVDPNGNVYILGSFKNTADFDPGAGTFNLTSAGADDIFVSRLDGSGNFVWAKRMGGTGVDFPDMLVRDASGSLYITGSFQNTADFDPGAGTFNLTSAGADDIFVSRLDDSGNLVWAKGMGSPQFDTGTAVALGLDGNVYLAGEFQGTVDFDPGPGISSLTSAGGMDIFMSKLNASGSFVWAKRIGGISNTDYVSDIMVDRDGYVYITGQFLNTIDFDPGAGNFDMTSTAGSLDAFICKLDGSGNFIWAKSMGGAGTDGGNTINLTSTGFVLTGNFSSTADLEPGPGIFNLTSAGADDIFIAKFETAYTFTDVPPDFWAWSYIERLYAAGVTG
ncbi:MAG: SBBP repeat-containing protein, partial [Syntrophothermus sp.]